MSAIALRQRLQRVPGAARVPVGGQRDVDGLLDQDALVALGLELRLALGERARQTALGLAEQLAGGGLVGGREAADGTVGERDRAALAHVLEAGGLQGVEVGRGREGLERVLDGGLDAGGVERGQGGVVGHPDLPVQVLGSRRERTAVALGAGARPADKSRGARSG